MAEMEGDIVIANVVFNLILSVITVLLALLIKEKLFRCSKEDRYHNVEVACGGSRLAVQICEKCTAFQRYVPASCWGKSGHVQSFFHAIFGRFGHIRLEKGTQVRLYADDGATVTYDIFKPKDPTKEEKTSVILIVPGIGNNSSAIYVQAFTQSFVKEGFHVAVVNHLGTLTDVPLTSPRIFTYGGTDDLILVFNDILQRYNSPQIIGLGISMGANVLLKFLGERPDLQKNFMFAASVCQGYDISRAASLMLEWEGLRRGYNFAMCRTMKKVLMLHKETFDWWASKGEGHRIDWEAVSMATSLQEIDEAASKHIAGYKSLSEFYHWSSSASYVDSVRLPILYINAIDDPLVPDTLLKVPRDQLKTNPNSLFVLTKYGGHLGFFEGGLFSPSLESWLDRAVKQYILVSYDLLANKDNTTSDSVSI